MASESKAGEDSNAMIGIMAMMFLLIVFCLLVWVIGHSHIVKLSFALFRGELEMMSWFGGLSGDSQTIARWQRALQSTNPANVTWGQLLLVAGEVGRFVRWPVVTVCGLLIAFIATRPRAGRFVRVMDFNALKQRNAALWPRTKPVSDIDLIQAHPDRGPWARAKSPIQFAVEHGLLRDVSGDVVGEAVAYANYQIDEAKAAGVMAAQLGAPWPEDVQQLPFMVRALFAAFAAYIARDKANADILLDQMGRTFREKTARQPHRMHLAGMDSQVLDAYGDEPLVLEVIEKHHYVTTVMSVLLAVARERSGILATADFIWLKTVERRLHYALNQVGRRTSWVEASGIRSHLDAEQIAGQSIAAPQIDTAVTGLRVALYSEGWING